MGKKCEKCGAELKEDARFCTSCGAPVIDESEQEIEKKQVNISKKKIVIVIATRPPSDQDRGWSRAAP